MAIIFDHNVILNSVEAHVWLWHISIADIISGVQIYFKKMSIVVFFPNRSEFEILWFWLTGNSKSVHTLVIGSIIRMHPKQFRTQQNTYCVLLVH